MEQSLLYFREILSNWIDHGETPRGIYERLDNNSYPTEASFIQSLSQEEVHYLNKILPKEMKHAADSQDFERMEQLNDVYEQLF